MGIRHLCNNHHNVYSIKIAGMFSAGDLLHGPEYLVMHGDGRWIASAAPNDDGPAIDLIHTFAAPALYDAHVHLYDGIDMRAFTRYGICRIRDLGSPPGVAVGFARSAGCRAWPEVIF